MERMVKVVGLATATVTCVIAASMVVRRVRSRRRWKRVVRVVEELEVACSTPVSRLKQVVDAMVVEMHAGLASEGGSKLKMSLTFVDNLPSGREKGTYYGLDLGVTNFSIFRIQLGGQRSNILEYDVERQPIPQHLMTGTSEELFDFIASSLHEFVKKKGTVLELAQVERWGLGFTFSFPMKHLSVSSAILIKWTKGFSIEEVINDVVATLALSHYHDEDTVAAVIIGTDTNACYLERTDAIIKCQGLLTTSGSMVVNMEWANFWSSHLPLTSYDIALDAESTNPNEQGFEKLITGMYLGEIVRRVILRMSHESDIFGPLSTKLSTPFILRTPLMAAMHEDNSIDLSEVGRVLREILEIPRASLKVRKLIVKVCDVVTRRAAQLAAAGIVGILKKIGRDGSGAITSGRIKGGSHGKIRRTVVAIEGGLYANYTTFREYLNDAVAETLGEEISRHVVLKVMEDGSGIGAALLAASLSCSSMDSL